MGLWVGGMGGAADRGDPERPEAGRYCEAS